MSPVLEYCRSPVRRGDGFGLVSIYVAITSLVLPVLLEFATRALVATDSQYGDIWSQLRYWMPTTMMALTLGLPLLGAGSGGLGLALRCTHAEYVGLSVVLNLASFVAAVAGWAIAR